MASATLDFALAGADTAARDADVAARDADVAELKAHAERVREIVRGLRAAPIDAARGGTA